MRSTRDLLQLVQSTIETSLPEKRLQALQRVRELLPMDERVDFDTAVGLACDGLIRVPKLKVILVHGIRTDAAWQIGLRNILNESPNIEVYPLGYGFFSVLGLIGPFRRGPVDKIKSKIHDICLFDSEAEYVIVAHSYGTYIVSKILRETSLGIKRLLFCGSVVRADYKWESLPRTLNNRTVINDVGTRDIFPVLASGVTFGYGPSGRLGFQSGRVYDRFFKLGHSDFFSEKHIRNYWIPFIVDGSIVPSAADGEVRESLNPIVGLISTGPWVFFFCLALLGFALWWSLM